MPRALFLSCSRTKSAVPRAIPAIERYDGPLFRVLRRYLEDAPVDPPNVWIVSAKHGVIPGDKPIKAYDRRMDTNLRPSFSLRVRDAVHEAYRLTPWTESLICGGEQYRSVVLSSIERLHPRPNLRIVEGGIGGQASRLRSWLHGEPEHPLAHPIDDAVRSATLLGVTTQISSRELLERAESLALGDESASRFETWFVQVGKRRVAPKWLVGKIFGVPVHRFRTADARRVLTRLGVEVRCVAGEH